MKVKKRKKVEEAIGHVGNFWYPHANPTEDAVAKMEEHDNGWENVSEVFGKVEKRVNPFGTPAAGEDEEIRFVIRSRLENVGTDDELDLEPADLPDLMCQGHFSLNRQLLGVEDGTIVRIAHTGKAKTKAGRMVETYQVEALSFED